MTGRHDPADAAEHHGRLFSGDVVKPRCLAQAQELVREGLPVLVVRVLDEVPLVQLAGERAAVVLVVALPEVAHEVAQLIVPRAVLGRHLRHVAPAREEHEEVVGRHLIFTVDFLHDDAAPFGIQGVGAAHVVQTVPPQIIRCDARRRPRLKRLDGHERERHDDWSGAPHDVERKLNVVVPVLQQNDGSLGEGHGLKVQYLIGLLFEAPQAQQKGVLSKSSPMTYEERGAARAAGVAPDELNSVPSDGFSPSVRINEFCRPSS